MAVVYRYKLSHIVRLHLGSSEVAYQSIYREEDEDGHLVRCFSYLNHSRQHLHRFKPIIFSHSTGTMR